MRCRWRRNDAPSMQAMQRVGKTFQEFDSNSSAMIVLEGDQPLGDAAHKYYDGLIDKLEADKKHVEHVQDFWGDPLTAVGCAERRRQGRLRPGLPARQPGREPGQRVRRSRPRHRRRARTPPPGVKAYVTGPARADATTSTTPATRASS